MAVNWALGLRDTNPGETFANAFKQGQQTQQQNTARNAMAALVQDPNNPRALAALAKVDPQAAMDFRKQQIEQQKALLAQHSDSILKGAQIIRQFNPKDQPSYTAALQAAQAAGIDISQVPQEFNPQYVNGIIKAAEALKPEGAQGKDIPVQAGGSVLHVNPDGTTQWTVMPSGPVPQPLTDDQIRAMKGGQTGGGSSGGFL